MGKLVVRVKTGNSARKYCMKAMVVMGTIPW
jgi:hypothetical protein